MADSKGRIFIKHPEVPGAVGIAFPNAFERVWEPKGWVVCSDEEGQDTVKEMKAVELATRDDRIARAEALQESASGGRGRRKSSAAEGE